MPNEKLYDKIVEHVNLPTRENSKDVYYVEIHMEDYFDTVFRVSKYDISIKKKIGGSLSTWAWSFVCATTQGIDRVLKKIVSCPIRDVHYT